MVRPLQVSNPKLTMKFNGGVNGWSESHFYTSEVLLSSSVLQAAAFALCKARCAALDGVNAKLFSATLSLDDVNRDSIPVDVGAIIPDPVHGYASIGGPDPSVTTSWTYQTVQVSWQVILSTNNPTTQPNEYLAGMPASTSQFGPMPTDDTPPTVASYLTKYLTVLQNGSWGALGRDFSDPTYPLASWTVIPATGAVPFQIEFGFQAPYPTPSAFPIGGYCRLQGATYTSPQKRLRLNGTYIVSAYNATTGQLTVAVPRLLVAPIPSAYGSLQAADGAVFGYTDWTFRPITHRKRGRPFGGGRGRR